MKKTITIYEVLEIIVTRAQCHENDESYLKFADRLQYLADKSLCLFASKDSTFSFGDCVLVL